MGAPPVGLVPGSGGSIARASSLLLPTGTGSDRAVTSLPIPDPEGVDHTTVGWAVTHGGTETGRNTTHRAEARRPAHRNRSRRRLPTDRDEDSFT